MSESDEGRSKAKPDDEQMAAVAISASIIVFFAVYWLIQVQSVRELLELAYG